MTIPLHHEAPADPTLMAWIKERLDQVVGQEPAVLVSIFGAILLAIPAVILFAYLLQKRRPRI